MTEFGERLKNIRKSKKITQQQLSKALGVGQSTIANYENNTRFPMENTLIELAAYLEVSLDYLMGIKSIKEENPSVSFDELKNNLLNGLLKSEEKEATQQIKESFYRGIPFTDLIEKIILPVMCEVGNLWEKEKINIAQEHYCTNVIENLIAQLNEDLLTINKKPYKVLLILPGYEEHILTLKIAANYFRRSGWHVYFIGKSVPIKDLEKIMLKEKIDVVVISITMDANLNSGEHLIHSIKRFNLKKKPHIVVGGNAVQSKEIANNFLGSDQYLPKLTDIESMIQEFEKTH